MFSSGEIVPEHDIVEDDDDDKSRLSGKPSAGISSFRGLRIPVTNSPLPSSEIKNRDAYGCINILNEICDESSVHISLCVMI